MDGWTSGVERVGGRHAAVAAVAAGAVELMIHNSVKSRKTQASRKADPGSRRRNSSDINRACAS